MSEQNLKEWNIADGHASGIDRKVLTHRCGINYEWAMDIESDEVNHWASKTPAGWYCGLCNAVPPEEIQFIADLANCWPLHTYDAAGRMLDDHFQ